MDRETWETVVRQSRLTSDAATSGHCTFRAYIRIVFTIPWTEYDFSFWERRAD